MASDRMMEYYYSMGQDCLHMGDMDEAVAYFRKAANMGAREAAYEIYVLGRQWEKGDGVDKDENKAENCYKISVEYGIEDAGLELGKLYLRGINGNKPNPRKARRMLEHCSDDGSAEAASLLGKIYDEGIMGKVNYDKAFRYYLLAAERGDSGAMLMTGMFYASGTSTQKDLSAAEMWIRKGRDAGDPDGDMTLPQPSHHVTATGAGTGSTAYGPWLPQGAIPLRRNASVTDVSGAPSTGSRPLTRSATVFQEAATSRIV